MNELFELYTRRAAQYQAFCGPGIAECISCMIFEHLFGEGWDWSAL